jgi:L-Ala-D/L-Glu epimerase
VRRLRARIERFALREAFVISRGARTEATVVVAEIVAPSGAIGRGECVPYARYGEDPATVLETVLGCRARIEAGMDRLQLLESLEPGAARNALDCALWDLEARESGVAVWDRLAMPRPEAVTSAYTLSLDTPAAMEAAARRHAGRPLLKLKLGGDGALERVRAVRNGAPRSRIIVDANEAWSLAALEQALPGLLEARVEMVEQPLPAGQDAGLEWLESPIPLAADESCHTADDIERLIGRYRIANIKLDKTGGLTEALRLRERARAAGLDIMVGCMVATSLAMAPALLLAAGARYVDLDGPLLLADDRAGGMREAGGLLQPPAPGFWGDGRGSAPAG